MLRDCRRCAVPDTKPDLPIAGEGVCSACRSDESRTQADRGGRGRELRPLDVTVGEFVKICDRHIGIERI